MTCRTHVTARYFDLFMPMRAGVAAFEDRWLRLLLRDISAGAGFDDEASRGAWLPRGPDPDEAYLLC